MSADIETPSYKAYFRPTEVSIADRESGETIATINAQQSREIETIIQRWRVEARRTQLGVPDET